MINRIKGIRHPEAYHGDNAGTPFFEGWYHKIVTKSGHAIVIIPGIYCSKKVNNHFSFIMIFDGLSGKVHFERFQKDDFFSKTDSYNTIIGGNKFFSDGISLNIKTEDFSISGSIDFIKMHGLGNDFVIIDLRKQNLEISNRAVKSIANRRTGVGCDQLIAIEEPKKSENDVRLRIWNADGGEVGACGNAMRCVGHLILKETNKVEIAIETVSGIIKVNSKKEGKLSVDMGPPRIHWNEIPLATECDTLSLDITINGLKDPVGVSMGNPHVVFFVEDICAVDLDKIGPEIENHPLVGS